MAPSRNRRWVHCIGLAGGLLTFCPGLAPDLLSAQLVQGRLVETGAERPVVSGTVRLMAPDSTEVARATTDSTGTFEMRAPRPGEYFLTARALGYEQSWTDLVVVRQPGLRMKLLIDPAPIPLREVVATGARPSYDRNQGFYDRLKKKRAGRFITREQIERRQPGTTADMLRAVPGLRVKLLNGQYVIEASHAMSLSDVKATEGCHANLYLDGARIDYTSINSIPPKEIEGMEIYANGAPVPAEFNSSEGAACGVVAIWTRLGGAR